VGGVLLHDPAAGDATKEAQRRKHHHAKHPDPTPRTIALRIFNNGPSHVSGANGSTGPISCCSHFGNFGIADYNETTLYSGNSPGLWVYIGAKYWFRFTNPLIGRPFVEIALNGRARNTDACCFVIPLGITIEGRRGLKEGETRTYNIAGPVLKVRRERDTKYHKRFTLELPAVL
jgi:hypothetical protein